VSADKQTELSNLNDKEGMNIGLPAVRKMIGDAMRDGGKCATLAVSSFFYALISNRGAETEKRAEAAIAYANGKGDATLSAILVE
jgi:hypothetical protein